jgi:hypothetical protein
VKSVALILRDRRDELWQKWADAVRDAVAADYGELIASQVGQHMVRDFAEDWVACSEAEPYELPGLYRQAEERVAGEACSRVQLGFRLPDVVRALEVLRGAVTDVLIDAMAGGEVPSFADTLLQLKALDAQLDGVLRAVWTAVDAAQASAQAEA